MEKTISEAVENKDFSKIEKLFNDECIKKLKDHESCPFFKKNKIFCLETERSCQLNRINQKKNLGKSHLHINFLFILACIEELSLCLGDFVPDIVKAAQAKKIFGFLESDIVLGLPEKKYALISFDAENNKVVFRSGKEIYAKEIHKINSSDTQWY